MEKRQEGSSADRSLEDILQEMNGKESTGNHALDALLRARDEESAHDLAGVSAEPSFREEEPMFEPMSAFENLVPAGHGASAALADAVPEKKRSTSRSRKKKS